MTRIEIGAIMFGIGAIVNIGCIIYNEIRLSQIKSIVRKNNEQLDKCGDVLNRAASEERPLTMEDVRELRENYRETTSINFTVDRY